MIDSCWLIIDSCWLTVADCQLLIDNWQLLIDNWQLLINNWQLLIDNWQLLIDNWQLLIDSCWLIIDSWWLMITEMMAVIIITTTLKICYIKNTAVTTKSWRQRVPCSWGQRSIHLDLRWTSGGPQVDLRWTWVCWRRVGYAEVVAYSVTKFRQASQPTNSSKLKNSYLNIKQ